ncbi:MAG TPA: pyridoxamine 5'-phosphate oxidase family protein [Armatimonadota bacterium]|nr:pyridoxamine 5'-phosphate oxidase family protein [Armatimonadota bacterium]
MPESSSDPQAVNRVRRRDRAVEDDAWIRSYLKEAPFGVLATEHGGQPFLTPLNFAYDEDSHALYFHGARTGRLFTNLAANPLVCFNACRMGALISASEGCAFDVEYDSVIVFGRARLIDDQAAIVHGLRLLVGKYAPDRPRAERSQPFLPSDVARTAVYRLDIDAWSAKRNPVGS